MTETNHLAVTKGSKPKRGHSDKRDKEQLIFKANGINKGPFPELTNCVALGTALL